MSEDKILGAEALLFEETDKMVAGQVQMLKAAMYSRDAERIETARQRCVSAYEQHMDATIKLYEVLIKRMMP